jgi:hypothetical protein
LNPFFLVNLQLFNLLLLPTPTVFLVYLCFTTVFTTVKSAFLQDSYARILEERQHQAAAPERPPFMPGRPRGSQGPSLSIEAEA